MKIEDLFIGAVIFGLVMTIGLNFYVDQMNANEVPNADSSIFKDKYTTVIETDAQDIYENVRTNTQTKTVSDQDTEASLAKQGYPAALSGFDSGAITGKTLQEASKQTGLIRNEFVNAATVIVGILVGMFMVYMLFRFKPYD